MSPTKNTSAPLSERSPNTISPSKTEEDIKTNNNDMLKMPATASFPIHNDQTPNYVSPSDAMMSPTSKKLSEIKGRRLAGAKQLNGRELFAKARALKSGSTADSEKTTTTMGGDYDSSTSSQSSERSS